jgi:S1-C subfamily serine protease
MATMLKDLSKELADAVEKAGGSLVRVEARRRLPASGVVWSAEGMIVTASHVVEREEDLTLGFPDGSEAPATFVGRDPGTDLALLKTEAKGLTAADWGEADELRVGNLVLALGRPGRTAQATLGVLSSALSREAGIAIPTATVRRVAADLAAHGRIRRGYLGVGAQPAQLPEDLAGKVGQETGLLLISVEPGSPAAQAGLMLGDVIVGMDGQPTRHMHDLLGLLRGDRVGSSVGVRVVRGGKIEEKNVTIGERP